MVIRHRASIFLIPSKISVSDIFSEVSSHSRCSAACAIEEEHEVIITGGISILIQEAKRGTEMTAKVSGKCGDVFLDGLRLVKARSPNVEEWTENMPIASGPYHTVTDLLETTDNCNMESNIFSQTCPHVNRQGFVFNDEPF